MASWSLLGSYVYEERARLQQGQTKPLTDEMYSEQAPGKSASFRTYAACVAWLLRPRTPLSCFVCHLLMLSTPQSNTAASTRWTIPQPGQAFSEKTFLVFVWWTASVAHQNSWKPFQYIMLAVTSSATLSVSIFFNPLYSCW